MKGRGRGGGADDRVTRKKDANIARGIPRGRRSLSQRIHFLTFLNNLLTILRYESWANNITIYNYRYLF